MKSIFTKIFCIVLLQGFTYNAFAHVYLDYPQGGETFEANTIVTIEWHIAIPHEQLNWDLLFSPDGGNTWQPIQLDLPVSQLTYTWVVPSISTSQARISIIQDNVDMDYQDESMNFTIVPIPMTPFIDILAQNLDLECDINSQQTAIQNWLDDHGGATAVGFCGDLVWTHDYVGLTNECGATGNAFVTFTVADSCGSASTSAYLTVFDISPPDMQVPATDMIVECGDPNSTNLLNNWLANHGGAISSDACGTVEWTYEASPPDMGCGLTLSTSVAFMAADECGNSSTTSATFSIVDNVAPIIHVPASDTTINCGDPNAQTLVQNWLLNHGGASATDDCGSVTWTNDFPALEDTCDITRNISVTFRVSDDCSNSDSTIAIITLSTITGTITPPVDNFMFKISPNPASDILKITFEKTSSFPVQLILFDSRAKLVLSRAENDTETLLPVSGYAPGMYFLHAVSPKSITTRKVIID